LYRAGPGFGKRLDVRLVARPLAADHNKADGYSLNAVLRCGVGRIRLDEPFLFFRTNRHDDFVRRKGRKSVADGETDVRHPGTSIDGLARKLLGRAFGHLFRMTDRFLVVGEPVEHALPYDRHHDLDRVGLPDMRAQYVVRMFDGADHKDIVPHDGNVPPSRTDLGCWRHHPDRSVQDPSRSRDPAGAGRPGASGRERSERERRFRLACVSAERVDLIPQCAECGAVWLPAADEDRREAYLTDDEPPELAFYCPECAEREFGERSLQVLEHAS
jgi:hypothetical protein